MKTELKDILQNGIVTDLFKTGRAVFIFNKISEFSSPINESKPDIKALFGYFQNLALNEAVLALSRIYDTPYRRYPNRCILNVVNILRDEKGMFHQ